ncbi:MAG TPA: EAL domain-containing protein [Chloroflexia bacterium]|nr:EAL domain-containing protein [Chloroflexia bacterium]
MSVKASLYVYGIIILGILLTALSLVEFNFASPLWGACLLFSGLAIICQFYEVEGTFRNSYYPHSVFFVAGSIMLDPFLFTLVIIIPHTFEWLYKRLTNSPNLKAWYIQPFNIANHILAGLAVRLLFKQVEGKSDLFHTPLWVIFIVFIALVYALINHFLIGLALCLARGVSFSQSGIMQLPQLLPEIVLGCLAYIVVIMWQVEPFLVVLAISPLVLMFQALKVPQLLQDAQIDAKTGLLNAKYFNKICSSEFYNAERLGRPLSLIMADLDLLRKVNNSYGHLAGDQVLSGVGKIIRQTLLDQHTAGRFGGEEFAIVLPDTSPGEAKIIAEQLRVAIQETVFSEASSGERITITMSSGVASYPEHGKTLTELTQAADRAVYQAKKLGRNRVVVFGEARLEERLARGTGRENSVGQGSQEQSLQELELRRALEEGQFELYYQPKIDMATNRIRGAEALVRWKHPEQGLLPPVEFIPLAEETGLILTLGRWILEEACRQVKIWNIFTRRKTPLVVSVNFSALQFQREDVVETISQVLKTTKIDPGWLEIEITESILMENTAYIVSTLQELKQLGIKLAMDDFGVGYSSLSYLRNFPLDTIKIDRTFVTGLDKDPINQALVEAIVTLARTLNFAVVAEGVETQAEKEKLFSLGCYIGQGYLFARPLPALSIEEFLLKEKPRIVTNQTVKS